MVHDCILYSVYSLLCTASYKEDYKKFKDSNKIQYHQIKLKELYTMKILAQLL